MISNTSFDKNEYLINNPEQGVAIAQSVRDNKSHSKTYFKQVNARDQKLAETINKLPNKMKNQLTLPVVDQLMTISKPANKKKKNNAKPMWGFDYSEDYHDYVYGEDYVADAMNEIANEIQERQAEADKAEYMRMLEQWQAEDVTNDDESVDEESFITHSKNMMALQTYYANLTPENKDDEYEFWLTFEIRAFEEGSRDITEVIRTVLDPDYDDEDRYKKDADDLLQEEIERRTEDALDDRF